MEADIIIYNGKCLSFQNQKIYDWVAIDKDKIVGLGFGDNYKNEFEHFEEGIDAKGASVLPGFYDSSTHFVQTALNSKWINLNNAACFEDIGNMIQKAHKENPNMLIAGYGLDELKLKEKRLPDRHFLDSYCNDAPVWLSRVEYHISILNTYGFLQYKIPYILHEVELDKDKMPTGIFRFYANAKLREIILNGITNAYRLKAAQETMRNFISKGITTINAMEGGFTFSDKDAEFIHCYKDAFPIDIILFYQSTDLKKIREMGLKRVGGSLFLDGTFGSRHAALEEDYADAPGNRGKLYFTQEEIDDLVMECYENKIQLSVHAIGERAIDQILSAHERAYKKTQVKDLRHRLEHAELVQSHHIEKAKNLGLIFSMQPAYEYYWGGEKNMYQQRLGNRYQRTNPYFEILNAGICICGGSDSDVTPADPLLGIHSAVNHPVEKHRVDVLSAVKMFTYNGAYAVGEENKKGDLQKGHTADIVILNADIFSVPKENIKNVQVSKTIKSGNIIYSNTQKAAEKWGEK